MYSVVIFDMDGVIIDSEPLWRKAYNNIFNKLGINLIDEQVELSKGVRVDEEVVNLCKLFKMEHPSPEEISNKIKKEVKEYIKADGKVMEGVNEAIELFRINNLRFALASSSDYSIIHTVMEKLGLEKHFRIIHSAEEEQYGKPHPGVYITTAKKMEVSPEYCLAIEDSFYGVLAAKAALMGCIAIPEEYPYYDERFIIADLIIDSLSSIDRIGIDNILTINESTLKS